jgi:hypothetical protein
LSRVELDVFAAPKTRDPLIVDIVSTDQGLPVFDEAARLARRIVDRTAVSGGAISVDFSSVGLAISEGQRLGIVLRSAASRGSDVLSSPGYRWYVDGAAANTYQSGSLYTLIGGDELVREARDAGFRTFVNIPEPLGGPMIAMAALVVVRRRAFA